MSRLCDVRLAYCSPVFAVMKVFALAFSGVGFSFAVAAGLDLAFNFQWGWGWVVISAGVGFSLAGLAFIWLARQFKKAIDYFFAL